MSAYTALQVRRAVRVHGLVQGVGFRPFVWRLAQELAVSGWVRNDAQGVDIEIQGQAPGLNRFLRRLQEEAPALARIDAIESRELPPAPGTTFRIIESRAGEARTGVAPDAAVCPACLAELFDPHDRR